MPQAKQCVGLTVALILGVLCWFNQAHTAHSFVQTDDSAAAINARSLFERHCARCHGKDGRAKTFRGKLVGARNLTDESWQAKVSDEQIAGAIKRGPGAMPSFEEKLSQAEIVALVSYVRQFRGTGAKK